MKIKIRDISNDGARIIDKINAADINLQDDSFVCLSPLSVDVFVKRADGALITEFEVTGKYEFTCARCLEIFERDRTEVFELVFEIDKKTEFVDCDEDLRQEMLLALSSKVLCKDECAGICPKCGTNINQQQCQCDK